MSHRHNSEQSHANLSRAGSLPAHLRGFTLLELLVVILVVGILAGLLLPAIQSSRESGRRLTCTNHLKQIGLAFQTHHDSVRVFPTGGWEWWTPPTYLGNNPAVAQQQAAGWAFQLLPYLEATDDWRGGSGATPEDRAVFAVGAVQPVYFCPSRRAPQALTYGDPFFVGGRMVTHALCDYAASNMENTGLVGHYRVVRASQVTDGLSKTLAVGDKRLNLALLGQWQEDDNEGYTAGWDEDTIRRTDQPPLADHRGQEDGEERFGSSHPSVFNVVLGDGSVHSISYEIDPRIFQYLGEIGDGEVLSSLDF